MHKTGIRYATDFVQIIAGVQQDRGQLCKTAVVISLKGVLYAHMNRVKSRDECGSPRLCPFFVIDRGAAMSRQIGGKSFCLARTDLPKTKFGSSFV